MIKVFLIGNLTADPALTETSSGIQICRFSVAVNRRNNSDDGERKADFYNITAWRGLAETVARYAHKGDKISVIGNQEIRTYETRDGETRTSVDITATDIEFLSTRRNDDNESSHERQTSTNARRKPNLQPLGDDFADGDIPF